MATQDLLTSEEMSALLETSGSDLPGSHDKRHRIIPYDFRRPDRISREQVRSLYLLHDLFAHSISSSLSVFLRTVSEVTLISVEQQAYSEYLRGLSDPTVICTLSLNPLPGMAALEINPTVAFPVIDRLLGGQGEPLTEVRAITEIEQHILESFFKIIADNLRSAWLPLLELDLYLNSCETRPQMVQIVAQNEVILAIVFQVQIGETRGLMSLCLPAVSLESVLQRFDQAVYVRHRTTSPMQSRGLLTSLSQVLFPVTAEARGTRATLSDLLQLVPGDVLRFDHSVQQPLTICVSDVPRFHGNLLDRDRRVSLRVDEFYDETGNVTADNN
jgi:flagellar motor switch protein FliM